MRIFVFTFLLLTIVFRSVAQDLQSMYLANAEGARVDRCSFTDGTEIRFPGILPLFTCELNDLRFSSQSSRWIEDDPFRLSFPNGMVAVISVDSSFTTGWKAFLAFHNRSTDTVRLSNVIPLGDGDDHIYITSTGPWALARAKLFRPGLGPVGIILPDNAWELGYSSVQLSEDLSVAMLARRIQMIGSERKRYETVLPPGSSVVYALCAESFNGPWQNGLKKIFHERYLYDLDSFDNTLYERPDLQWIRNKYLITLQAAWDHRFYDKNTGRYTVYEYLQEGEKLMGGYDVYCIWPTWPRLGLDQRNQWDLYADLPWGLGKLKEISAYAKQNGTRFFITFNPWDESTRKEDPMDGMTRIIEATNADGVVLDTYGWSTTELQQAADRVKQGVVMYSEGQAVPKDMPGITAGRVHDAIYMPPPLNMNKLIKPQHAIFRVLQLSQGPLHRESAISFFNGIGTEINTFAPGRPEWIEEEYLYLGRTLMTLRENTSSFTNDQWTPLINTLRDSIWVNQWIHDSKTIYTVLSLIPEGYSGPLFEAPDTVRHFVSLWNHTEITPVTVNEKPYLPVDVAAFSKSWLNTRREGNVDCIAAFPSLLRVRMKGDSLFLSADTGDVIRIWKNNPSYNGFKKEYPSGEMNLSLTAEYGSFYGKYVIQLFKGDEIMDERIVSFDPGKPWMVNRVVKTRTSVRPPSDMVEIPAGSFLFSVYNDEQFIPYPDYSEPRMVTVNRFFMDRYPVTNAQFFEFLEASGYRPDDPTNFLKHWVNGMYPDGQAHYPVVFVSLDDARAYASWAEKRLPTEIEWQYAAQGTDGREWPWGNEFSGTKCNNAFERSTPVDAFEKGKSPFKVEDMVGNVWQYTSDVYENGSNTFVIIRGGSYFKPSSSWWYIKGGPQPLSQTQMMLLVSPGYDRSATVGFRCVKDAEEK